jgi:uncharacterized protein (TIGR02271 family)
LFGQNHLMPVEQAQIDDQNNTIEVPYGGDQIKNGPSFDSSANLSPDDENQIYSYYGMQRSTASSPTGYAGGTSAQGAPGSTRTELEGTDQQDINVPLSEEDLQVGKREEEAGQVRLRKVVRTEQEEVPVELRREDVEVERVPASGGQAPSDAFQEKEIDVPLMEEQPVVSKEARVTGQVHVGKQTDTETRTVSGDVRREDVEIEEDDNTDSGFGDQTS